MAVADVLQPLWAVLENFPNLVAGVVIAICLGAVGFVRQRCSWRDSSITAIARRIKPRATSITACVLQHWNTLLGGVVVALFVAEVACYVPQWRSPLCGPFITLAFIEHATTLSFSLTAFLLVGAVAATAVGTVVVEQLSVQEDEYGLVVERDEEGGDDESGNGERDTGDEENGSDNESVDTPSAVVTLDIDEYCDLRVDDDGPDDPAAEWTLTELSVEQGELDNIEYRAVPNGAVSLGLDGRRYALRPLYSDDDPPETIRQAYDHQLKGRVESEQNLNYDLYFTRPEDDEERRVHWLLREASYEFRTLTQRLRRAVTYSISASVLGILILGYPWETEGPGAPWPGMLAGVEDPLYLVATYGFTAVFLGMLSTSLGLLELLSKLLDR